MTQDVASQAAEPSRAVGARAEPTRAVGARAPGGAVAVTEPGTGCSRPFVPLDRSVKEFALPARPMEPPGDGPGPSRAATPEAGARRDGVR